MGTNGEVTLCMRIYIYIHMYVHVCILVRVCIGICIFIFMDDNLMYDNTGGG